jgi:hypothetical protein
MKPIAWFVLALLAVTASPAAAEERITRFLSEVTVARNGGLEVTETIRLQAESRQIRHGFVRDFPILYRRGDATYTRVGFTIESVMRDGAPESFVTQAVSNGVRLRIGREDTWLSRGEHEYVIRYRTTRQIGRFADVDELTWNATGNGWTFAINAAEARITLPDAVSFRHSAVYTGPQGATAGDAILSEEKPGQIVFRTTRALPAGSGMTILAAWPKGVVDSPNRWQLTQWWIDDHRSEVTAVLALLLLVAYYAAWFALGRGPRRGTIIPLFAPPAGFSAADVRYVDRAGFDNRALTAAIVELAVLRHVMIHQWGMSARLERRDGASKIGGAEQAVKSKLFAGANAVDLIESNHRLLARARTALHDVLTATHERLFRRHGVYAFIGLALWLAATLVSFVTFAEPMSAAGASWLLVLGLIYPAGLIIGGTAILRRAPPRGRRARLVRLGGSGLALAGAALGIYSWLDVAGVSPAVLPGMVSLATAPLTILGFSFLTAPTVAGRRIKDHVDGFRQYLAIAEEDRLEALNPPEKTPELFERFLPYAIALDVENSWARKFAGVLATAAAGTVIGAWYKGPDTWQTDPMGFADSLGDSFSDAISSASSPPGSSDAGGGFATDSGSSGSGGGGGGGSGW